MTTISDKKEIITIDPAGIESIVSGCCKLDIKPLLPSHKKKYAQKKKQKKKPVHEHL